MADAMVETTGRPGPTRFFCHRCNVEFEDTLQEYICPYCSGGFIEEMAAEANAAAAGASDNMETDSLDSTDEDMEGHPIVNDLAFLMSGGRLRGMLGGAETLLQQFVWALAGGNDARTAGNGAPFVLVGAPGDYVLGGEGLDAVVTQLLGQLESSGPPPLPRDQIEMIQSVAITEEQVQARLQCSVCWEPFNLNETVSQLSCTHVFHSACIQPWLQLHATCPICRRNLLPDGEERAPTPPLPEGVAADDRPLSQEEEARFARDVNQRTNYIRGLLAASESSTPSSSSSASSVLAGVWGPATNLVYSSATSSPSNSTTSSTEPNRQPSTYNMEFDFD